MRAMKWVLGLGVALSTAGIVGTGCGDDVSNSPTDSGSDVTTDGTNKGDGTTEGAASDAPADMVEEPCAVDADIQSYPIPDADIPDTNLPISGCVACVENACPMAISMCNMSCTCKVAFTQFEMCFAQGMSITTCGQILLNAGIPLMNLTCAFACAGPCGVNLGDGGGGDGGGGDAPTDSPADGAGD